jgi:hypothetical protein
MRKASGTVHFFGLLQGSLKIFVDHGVQRLVHRLDPIDATLRQLRRTDFFRAKFFVRAGDGEGVERHKDEVSSFWFLVFGFEIFGEGKRQNQKPKTKNQ